MPQELPSPERGFGVTDLLMTLAVAAVMIAASVPAVTATLRTYERNGAARQVLADIRASQSEALMRGAVVALQWGADPAVQRPASEYRIVRDASGACGFPAASAPEDGTSVITGWTDVSSNYRGAGIQSIRDAANKTLAGVMFNSLGASVNTCTGVNFPIFVTVADASGDTRTIEIRSAGSTRLQ